MAAHRNVGERDCAIPEERLPEIFDSVADGVTVLDRAGILRFANIAAARLMGRSHPEEIVGRPSALLMGDFELLQEDGSPMDPADLPSRIVLAGAPASEAVVRFRRRGSLQDRWSTVRSRLVPGPTSDEDLAVTAFQDITAQKHTELRLALLSEASAIFGRSTDYHGALKEVARLVAPHLADWCLIDVADAEGGEPQRVAAEHHDPALVALALEMPGRWPSTARPASWWWQVTRGGQPVHARQVTEEALRAVAHDDEHLDAMRRLGIRSALVVPLVARGQVLGALSLLDSESQRTLEREDVALAEELGRRAGAAIDAARLLHETESALRERDEFVAVASHDMRTPLAAIRGYAQLAERHLAGQGEVDRDALGRWIRDIGQSADRLAGLVTELMDASLLRGGRSVPLLLQPVDLVALVRERVADHARTAGDRLSLAVDAGEVVGDWDGSRLARVLDNLLGNAEKYSQPGAPITVRVGVQGETAFVAVADRGIGIPPADRRRIFARNYRARNARRVAGSGLGLTGSERLVRQMGGWIEVESQLGVGSTFTVRLPIAASPRGMTERAPAPIVTRPLD